MKKKVCVICGEEFRTSNDSDICFCCTLRDLAGGFNADEEDIIIAKERSGYYTDEDIAFLKREENFVNYNTDFDDEDCD